MLKFLLPDLLLLIFLFVFCGIWLIYCTYSRHHTEEPVLGQLRHVRAVQRLPAAIFHKVRYRLKGTVAKHFYEFHRLFTGLLNTSFCNF
jgi:hypothetical protein